MTSKICISCSKRTPDYCSLCFALECDEELKKGMSISTQAEHKAIKDKLLNDIINMEDLKTMFYVNRLMKWLLKRRLDREELK